MISYQLSDVFTPGGMPSLTYVSRDHLDLERKIAKALVRRFAINVVTGPTKSGKSVLCHRVLDESPLVTIEGGQVRNEEEFWVHIGHRLQAVASRSYAKQSGSKDTIGGTVGWSWGAKLAASANMESSSSGTETLTYSTSLKLQCIDALVNNKISLLVDDFHYIDATTQRAIIQGIKGPVMNGLGVFLLAVPHRAFDPISVENEVEGRFKHIEIPEWSVEDLRKIPDIGFPLLNISCEEKIIQRICNESFGNPLLVQEVCSEFCQENGVDQTARMPVVADAKKLTSAFKEIAQSKGFPKFQKLRKGPQARKARQPRALRDGTQEDIYSAIMLAISRTGPKATTTYDEIRASMKEIWHDLGQLPQKNEITAALSHMTRIAREEIKGEPPLEWVKENDELVITDPFLLFYMKYAFIEQEMA